MSFSKLNYQINFPKSYTTIMKLATIPFAAFMWYLYYKSKRSDREHLYLIKSNDTEKTTSAEGFKVTRVKIPQRAVGAIIGKEGATIKRLQHMTRTTITFVDRPSGDIALHEQKIAQECFWDDDKGEANSLIMEELLIRGLSSNVDEAERKILDIVQSVPPIIKEDIQIDKKFIGRIVGRSGESINKLRNTYRVKIEIERDVPGCSGNESSWRRLTLKGLPDQVQSAKAAIQCIISECEEQMIARSGSKNVKPMQSVPSTKSKSNLDGVALTKEADSYTIKNSNEDVPPVGDILSVDGSFNSGSPNLPLSSTPLPPAPECLPQATFCVFPSDTSNWHKVMVSSVSNCANFFIHLVVPETRKLEPLVQELTSYFSNLTYHVKESDLYIGQIVAGYYPPDNTWQRARIVSFKEPSSRSSSLNSLNYKNNDMVDVDYVDYGDCNSLPINKVYPLVQKQFLELPFQAIRVILHGIEPAEGSHADWSEEAISYFEECVMGSQWQVLHARRVIPALPGTTPFVELEDRNNASAVVNISSRLVASGYARWSSNSS